MAASHIHSSADETDKATCHDTFPEVAYFEVPSELSNKSVSSKTRDLVKHPAFREISAINGEINRMALKSLKVELDALGLDSRGTKDVLRKRLKAHERRRVLTAAGIEDPNTPRQHYTHLLVIDFEATCEEHQTKDYVHEIIEFPAVLVRVDDVAVVAEFHSLVRPVLNPTLSPFCSQLTGIPQDSVDSAPCFPEVLSQFERWLAEQGVTDDGRSKLAVATDGPWDMARFLLMQCSVSKLPFPTWARSWINLRKIFSNFYVTKRLCLSEMLSALGLEFRGRPHCGLDDARNIAAIAEVLVRDGAAPRVNETIAHLPRSAPPSLKGSSVSSVTLKEFETSERRRLRASGRNTRTAAVGAGIASPSINFHSSNDTSTIAYAIGGTSLETCNVVDGVCEGVGDMELSRGYSNANGNCDVVGGGTESMMCNGHSTSSNVVGRTNGYVETSLNDGGLRLPVSSDGEDDHRYQDDKSGGSFLPNSTDDSSRNCYSISRSTRVESPSLHSSTSFSSHLSNSSYSSPHRSNRIISDQDKLYNAGGSDTSSRNNCCTSTTTVDFQDSPSSIPGIQNAASNPSFSLAPSISSPSSECNATPLPAGHSALNAQEKLDHYRSMPYVNIEYPSSGVSSTASSASPRSVSRQSSYAEHGATDHHSSVNHHPEDGSHTRHQAFAEPSLNKNALGSRRPNNRRRNHNNNDSQVNVPSGTTNQHYNSADKRPPHHHHPVNKGSSRYPNRNFDDSSSSNSSNRGKLMKKAGGAPGKPRGGNSGRGGLATSFFRHVSTPVSHSSASISMDLSDTNEFPVLGSVKRCPR